MAGKNQAKAVFFIISCSTCWQMISARVLFAQISCTEFSQADDLFQCSLSLHPWVLQAEAKADQGKNLQELAEQRPNPELDANYAIGRSQDKEVLNSEVILSHIFELGGKRPSRIEKSQADLQVISSEVLKAKEEVALLTATTLYRLRQILAELEAVREALQTFSGLREHLLARHRITPEQSVILTTFRLVESDYLIKQAQIRGEEDALLQQLKLVFGGKFVLGTSLLPPAKSTWPVFHLEDPDLSFSGSQMNRMNAELAVAQAKFSLAQSQSWPNLKIGPMYQAETQAGIAYRAFGVNVSVALPLYQRNGGGRAFAESGVHRFEVQRETGIRQMRTEREQEIIRYRAAIAAFKENTALKKVNRGHQSMEKLFKSGLIQSANVIETHRQMVDLTRNVNQQELSAIRSLWRLYAIEGRVLKEKL